MHDNLLRPRDLRDTGLWVFASALAALVYGPALTDFTLSIDEELHSYPEVLRFGPGEHGRWGLSLLRTAFPNLGALPFLPTLLLCMGLAFSAVLLSRLIVRNRKEAFVFVGFFVSSPIWLHVGQFNTISWATGIALALIALAAVFAVGGKADIVLAGLFAGFAIAVYQGMLFLYALIALVLSARNRAFWGGRGGAGPARLRFGPALSLVIAAVFYYSVNFMILALLHADMRYSRSWIRLYQFKSSFAAAAASAWQQLSGFLIGSDETFLGRGAVVLLLPWLGFIVGARGVFDRRVDTPAWRLVSSVSMALAIVIALSPVVVAAGIAPTRSLVALPFLYALMAANAFSRSENCVKWVEWVKWGAFGSALFVGLWISTTLFYADNVARQRDSVLALRIVNRVDSVGRPTFGDVIPVAVVGKWSHEVRGPALRVQIFGESFFEHDGGSPWRIGSYLRLKGVRDFEMVPVTRLRDRLDRIDDLPSWPQAGSVAVVDDVVVVKLGPLSYQQKKALQ